MRFTLFILLQVNNILHYVRGGGRQGPSLKENSQVWSTDSNLLYCILHYVRGRGEGGGGGGGG